MLTSVTKSSYVSPRHNRSCTRLPQRYSGVRLRPVTKDLKLIVGARLRAARKSAGMTQSRLAEACGRTVEAISNIERGISLPPLDVLDLAADALGVTLADLVETPRERGNLQERAVLEAEGRAVLAKLPVAHLRAAAGQLALLAVLAES